MFGSVRFLVYTPTVQFVFPLFASLLLLEMFRSFSMWGDGSNLEVPR